MNDLAKLIARARTLAFDLERAADRATAAGVWSRPEAIQQALAEAVTTLYLGERHKYEQVLRRIVDTLSPELGAVLSERGAKAAYDVLHPED